MTLLSLREIQMTNTDKLKKLQADFYDVLTEICKSQAMGGLNKVELLYEDLCGLKDQLDDIVRETI